MFRSLMTIIRELYLHLAKVIFMLKHWVKLRRYIYIYILGDVAACHRAACVLYAVQSETVERHVCCVLCRVRLTFRRATCVLCRVRLTFHRAACVLCAVQSETHFS